MKCKVCQTRERNTGKSYCSPCQNSRYAKKAQTNYEFKHQGVYALYSNGECLYVGESSQINRRRSIHFSNIKNCTASKPQQQEFYKKLSQHTPIVFGILEETPNHKEREQYWINKLKPKYNA